MVELIVAISIMAILATLAIPNIQDVLRNNRITAQSNELIAIINLARNEAIRRNLDLLGDEDVVLRLDATTNGWNGNVVVTAGDTNPDCPVGVIRCINNTQVELTPGTTDIRFDSRGYLVSFQPITVCLRHAGACRGDRQHRVVEIWPSGRVQADQFLACDASCPGFEDDDEGGT